MDSSKSYWVETGGKDVFSPIFDKNSSSLPPTKRCLKCLKLEKRNSCSVVHVEGKTDFVLFLGKYTKGRLRSFSWFSFRFLAEYSVLKNLRENKKKDAANLLEETSV